MKRGDSNMTYLVVKQQRMRSTDMTLANERTRERAVWILADEGHRYRPISARVVASCPSLYASVNTCDTFCRGDSDKERARVGFQSDKTPTKVRSGWER
jgi:hypothetical protein